MQLLITVHPLSDFLGIMGEIAYTAPNEELLTTMVITP